MEHKRRPSTEKNLPHSDFRLKLGTINKNNPEVIYIEGKTFISPLNDEMNFKNVLQSVRRNFNFTISETLKSCDIFENKFILDFQVANSGIRMSKKSFLSFQILFRQDRNNILPMKVLKNKSLNFIMKLMGELKYSLLKNNFSISKTKKESIYIKVE